MLFSHSPVLRNRIGCAVPAILLIGVLQMISAKTLIFNAGVRAEKLKGKPKIVRIEKQEMAGPTEGGVSGKEVAEYQPDGREVEHFIYRSDGTLSYRYFYEYSGEGALSKITTVDGSGNTVQSRLFRSPETGVEEEVALDPNGREFQRVVTKRDRFGRIVECAVQDASGSTSMRLILRYDERGLLRDGELAFENQMALRLDVKYDADRRTILTCYAPNGTILMRIETREDELNRELAQLLFAESSPNQRTKIEKIDARDAFGNWTQKTIFQGSTDQTVQVTTKVTRTITYY